MEKGFAHDMTMVSINPATGQQIKSYAELSDAKLGSVLGQADETIRVWRRSHFSERTTMMNSTAQRLRQNAEAYVHLMAQEMGKPIVQGRSEIEKCAWVCEYYAEHAKHFLASMSIATDASKSFVCFEPLGGILAVMPWNFPFWQVFRAAVPAIMAGNGIILKHASNVPGCALAIEEIFRHAGFPDGLFRTVLVGTNRVAELIEHPVIKAVTLTGSTAAGKQVAAKAGAMLKKTVLELGGSDPYVVLEDADLEATTEACVASRLINSGQSCIAAKRFIVVESIRQRFEELMVEKMRLRKLGDPMDETIHVGPLARFDLRDSLHEQVTRSVEKGAKLLCGGHIPESKGAYYPPTVLTHVRKGMSAYDEETFGPVAAIIAAKDEDEAIRIANDSPYGLGAAVFTQDTKRGEHLAAACLEAGCCFVNDFVRSDPRLPFGGIKQSGYGRELSIFGIREFVNIKTVYVK